MTINNAYPMNILSKILVGTLILCMLGSCSTTEKFTVHGNPGTKIYTPDKKELDVIPQSGKATIKVDSHAYMGYLLTHDDALDQWVPFALDVRKKSRAGTKAAVVAGYTLSTVGLIGMVAGTVAVCIDSESPVGVIGVGAGGAATLGGIGLGLPASARLSQLSYQYNFSYQKSQRTNTDLLLTGYVAPQGEQRQEKTTPARGKAKSAEPATDTSKAKRGAATGSSKAKKKRKTAAEQVVDEYTGSGTLTLAGDSPETLGDIRLVISYVDNNTVAVEILEDNEPFFESEELYTVKRNKDGSFSLTHKQIPSVKFTILKSGKFDYKHPRVNIDGDNYTLTLTGLRAR